MKIIATPVTSFQSPSRFGAATRVPEFIALMKPRVMSLAVFTAFVGLMIAPIRLDGLHVAIAMLAIAAGAGAAGALNMWYDADIDALMARTATRPIPSGRISRPEAFAFGLVLASTAVAALAIELNIMAAALLAVAISFYTVVYTAWLKRLTPQNIVIGGAAGALPPVIGWAAATGKIGLEPFILFLIIFMWTPPHFWALSLNRANEYGRAGIPMLPVVAGRVTTKRHILGYSAFLLPISLLPWLFGYVGPLYGAAALVSGVGFVVLAARLRLSSRDNDFQAAHHLFGFSILYLFLLFAALLADSGGNRWRSDPSAHFALTTAGLVNSGAATILSGPAHAFASTEET